VDEDREFGGSQSADSSTAGGAASPEGQPASNRNDPAAAWAPHPIPELAPRPAPSWDTPGSVPPSALSRDASGSVPPSAPGWAALTPGWQAAPPPPTPGWAPPALGGDYPAQPTPQSPPPNWAPPTPGWSPPQDQWSAPPNAWGPQGPGWQPGFGAGSPTQTSGSRPLLVALGILVGAVVVAASIGLLYSRVAPSPSRSPVAASQPADGRVVFSDDFTNDSSGWFSGQTSGGSTLAYATRGYEISKTTSDPTDVFAAAPYGLAVNGLLITASEYISTDSSDTSGIGLLCRRGTGDNRVQYEFVVSKDGEWTVELRQGVPSLTTAPTELRRGTSPTPAGATPITLKATCDTAADGRTTRLIFVVAGSTVVDFLDKQDALHDNGWFGGVVAAIDPPSATIFVTTFEEREISG
jgi:hypothetical protein